MEIPLTEHIYSIKINIQPYTQLKGRPPQKLHISTDDLKNVKIEDNIKNFKMEYELKIQNGI